MALAAIPPRSPPALGGEWGVAGARGGGNAALDLPQSPGSNQPALAASRSSGELKPHRTPSGPFRHGEQRRNSRSQSCADLRGGEATAKNGSGSGPFGSPGRPRPKTAALALPPIKVKKQPLRFEDLYALAKVRVSKKAAQARSSGGSPAGLNELPTLPKMARAAAEDARLNRARAKATGGSAGSGEAAEEGMWAAAALAEIPPEETSTGSLTPPQSSQLKVRRNSLTIRRMPSMRSVHGLDDHEAGKAQGAAQSRGSFSMAEDGADPEGGEGLEDVLYRLAQQEEGFSDRELNRLRTAFYRFKVPGSADLHIEDVPDLLGYLGRVITNRERVMPLLKEVTSYDYIDFDEFVEFMGSFNAMERELFQEVFNEFDEDESGEISVQELRQIVGALGFMPLRKMIMEALHVVDQDTNGQLNFDEFVTFLTVYRHAEGFTRQEVTELKDSFDKFAVREKGDMMLPPEMLSESLVKVFGLQVADAAEELGALLASGQGLQKSSLATNEAGEPECLTFPEFLIFGRKIREDQLKKMRQDFKDGWGTQVKGQDRLLEQEHAAETKEFDRIDTNRNGKVSELELRAALRLYGYTPLRQVMEEISTETLDGEYNPGYELTFNEFFDFMLVLRHRDGFLRSEVQAFRSIFERFDDDHSGEINALELSDLMRFLGYTANLDVMRGLVIHVDKNESGQLDFNEFLHLMRLYREAELDTMYAAFERSMDKSTGRIHGRYLTHCMQELGYDNKEVVALLGDRMTQLHTQELDFDNLVKEIDLCREAKVVKQRKKAGFTTEELSNFKSLFETFDKDHSGHIDNLELIELLKFFNWQPRSKDAQKVLMTKLDVARARAREAGITDVGEDGSSNIKFWTFVQLARMLKREMEAAEEQEVAKVVKELQLSDRECEQFRSIFKGAIDREKEKTKEAGPQAERVPEYGLKAEGVRSLIRSLGVQLTTRLDDKLTAKLRLLEENNVLCFTGFLRFMMWMVGVNFAGVNEAAAKYA